MEKNRGYSMPLLTNKKEMKWTLILMPPLMAILAFIEYWDVASDGRLNGPLLILFLIFVGSLVLIYLGLLGSYLAWLHFVPEGVAVTIFGITIWRVPEKRIRLIAPARAVRKGTVIDKIALCDYSLEELTNHAYKSKPKLFRNSREFRTGEWADEYLSRRLFRSLKPDLRLFWIWWDPERAEALRSLYPDAQWMDLSKDRIFDKQLEEFSSENPR